MNEGDEVDFLVISMQIPTHRKMNDFSANNQNNVSAIFDGKWELAEDWSDICVEILNMSDRNTQQALQKMQ